MTPRPPPPNPKSSSVAPSADKPASPSSTTASPPPASPPGSTNNPSLPGPTGTAKSASPSNPAPSSSSASPNPPSPRKATSKRKSASSSTPPTPNRRRHLPHPVRLEPCAIPERLSKWQFVDLFVPGGYERLLTCSRTTPRPTIHYHSKSTAAARPLFEHQKPGPLVLHPHRFS